MIMKLHQKGTKEPIQKTRELEAIKLKPPPPTKTNCIQPKHINTIVKAADRD